MPVVRVWERMRSYRAYNEYKNWESWISHEEMMAESEKDNPHDPTRMNEMPGRKRRGGKDLKWSEWDIQSAEDYDRYFVPKLGNDKWAKMIGGR